MFTKDGQPSITVQDCIPRDTHTHIEVYIIYM